MANGLGLTSAPPLNFIRAPSSFEMRILVADDDSITREGLIGLLNKWAFETVPAADGTEALSILTQADAPRVALLDWAMPGAKGVEICRRLRELGKATYVVLLVARGSRELITEGIEAGANDYVTKPLDTDELRVRVGVAAGYAELQEELERLKGI
jgi:sigma-B regulation protein RsbU (phosphoserine phosphatase)